jgi:hypothetical protein
MWPRLRAAGVILAALLAIAGTANGVDRPASQGRTATTVHLYSPFNGGGIASGVQVARSASGYCWTNSGADARNDAYRCFVGNFIHDPCFADQTSLAKYVLCPLYLPVSKVLRINLTKRLPSNPGSGDPTQHAPWAVRTTGGTWCTSFTGATGQIAGMPIHYGCTGGGILLGDPHRSASAPWTIFYAASFKSSQYRPVTLASVWW